LIADESADVACFGLWGPAARGVLAPIAENDVGDAALPQRRAATIRIGGVPVLAARLSYAGELGWELYMAPDWAVGVWDRLAAAGQAVGLAPIGYRALDALRIEKGYRYYGADLTMLETPDEAGLGAFVRLTKGSFIGRDAIARQREAAPGGPSRLLRTVVVGDDPAYLPVYGGEAVRRDGRVVGRLRSVTYGYGVSRTVGYVYLPGEMQPGDALSVDVLGARVPAVVAADVLHDPAGDRMRG
jgi:glycine cleavage system aminomethyltransferase T